MPADLVPELEIGIGLSQSLPAAMGGRGVTRVHDKAAGTERIGRDALAGVASQNPPLQ